MPAVSTQIPGPGGFRGGLAVTVALSLALGTIAMPRSPALTHDSAYFLSVAENLTRDGRFAASIADAGSLQMPAVSNSFMQGYPLAAAALLAAGVNADAALYVLTLLGLVGLGALLYSLAWCLT